MKTQHLLIVLVVTCLVGLVKSVVDGKDLKDTLLYADICGHLSTYSLGTLKTLDKNE